MDQPFAIITFRATGPIKTWSDMRGANVHNARTKPIEHAVPGAPGPEHLIGSGDLVADTKTRLRKVGIDPARMRKNGVIAYEAIMTASPAFFDQGTPAEREARMREWTSAQVAFAKKRWGVHRVVSMVLHLDEKTPHIHIVVVPLEAKGDARRRDNTTVKWSLVGRMISGPGKFDQLQDDYAAAMAPFGLVRGVAGSGRKNEPMADFIARTQRERVSAQLAQAAAAERERELFAALARVGQERADIDKERSAVTVERQRLLSEQADLVASRAAIARERDQLHHDMLKLAQGRAEIATERASLQRDRHAIAAARAEVERDRERLAAIGQKASAFVDRLARVPGRDLHPTIQQAVAAANAMRSAGMIASVSPGTTLVR